LKKFAQKILIIEIKEVGEGDALFHPHLSLPHQRGGVEGTEWLPLKVMLCEAPNFGLFTIAS